MAGAVLSLPPVILVEVQQGTKGELYYKVIPVKQKFTANYADLVRQELDRHLLRKSRSPRSTVETTNQGELIVRSIPADKEKDRGHSLFSALVEVLRPQVRHGAFARVAKQSQREATHTWIYLHLLGKYEPAPLRRLLRLIEDVECVGESNSMGSDRRSASLKVAGDQKTAPNRLKGELLKLGISVVFF